MKKIKIIGYGTYLPKNKVIFKDQVRYHSTGENQVDMAVEACNNALSQGNIKIEDIDLILSASAVAAQPIPATAVLIHEKIAKGLNIPAFDVNSSCTSFITALEIASNYIELNQYKNILIVASDISSIGLNEEQKESFELFSDGAAAIIITKSKAENVGVVASLQKTFSEGAHSTEIRGGGSLMPSYKYDVSNKADYLFDMKGREILLTTARSLPLVFEEFFEKNNITLEDIDLIIPHQASKALAMVMNRLNISTEKYVDCVQEYGNMVSVSVPFVLCKLLEEKKIKNGDRLLLCGTAAGLTINMLLLNI